MSAETRNSTAENWSTECMGVCSGTFSLDTGHWWSDFGAYAAGAYWNILSGNGGKSRLPVKTPVAPVLWEAGYGFGRIGGSSGQLRDTGNP